MSFCLLLSDKGFSVTPTGHGVAQRSKYVSDYQIKYWKTPKGNITFQCDVAEWKPSPPIHMLLCIIPSTPALPFGCESALLSGTPNYVVTSHLFLRHSLSESCHKWDRSCDIASHMTRGVFSQHSVSQANALLKSWFYNQYSGTWSDDLYHRKGGISIDLGFIGAVTFFSIWWITGFYLMTWSDSLYRYLSIQFWN